MSLKYRLEQVSIEGKIAMVRRALDLLVQGAELSAADQAAARILDQALADRRTDIPELDAEIEALDSGIGETVWPHVMGVLGRAGRGERRGVTAAAVDAIRSISGRVERVNPVLSQQIWEVE